MAKKSLFNSTHQSNCHPEPVRAIQAGFSSGSHEDVLKSYNSISFQLKNISKIL